jgi:hypothetical protein
VAEVLGALAGVVGALVEVVDELLDAHEVGLGCVFTSTLPLEEERGGSVSVVLPLELLVVLVPRLGPVLLLPVSGLVGVASGVGVGLDELGEPVGLDVVGVGVGELVLVGVGVDEAAFGAAEAVALVDDGHAGAVALVWLAATLVDAPTPPDRTAEELWLSAVPPLLLGLLLLLLVSPATWASDWRNGGMAASRTPTANTQMPTARAGRSIASRQSLGRCGARRECLGEAPCAAGEVRPLPAACRRRAGPARSPAIAMRKAAIRDGLAVAYAG